MRFLNFSFLRSLLAVVLSCIFAAGCSYKSEVRQGNDDLPEKIDSIKIGMDKTEVRSLLGASRTPTVFAQNNWIYYYRRRTPGFFPTVEEWSVQLVFDGDTLTEIRPLKTPQEKSSHSAATDGETSE